KADATIFSVTEMNYDTLTQRLRELAFLNSGVHIEIRDDRTEKHHEFRNEGYSENIFCFTNTIKNLDGGTHLVGFKGALTRTMNKYVEESGILQKLKLSLEGDDIREGLAAVISVKVRDPKFSSQTKDKLVSSHVKTWVEQVVGQRLGEF